MIRHIKRNILKKQLGTNRISLEWHRLQVKKWGGNKLYSALQRSMRKRKTA